MNKLFQYIGIIILACFSFFYTEKTAQVIKEYDSVMIDIKKKAKEYKVNYKNAIINNDTITPGISGSKINTNKSYNKMKRYGNYNESLFVYEKIPPKISIKDNKDKYILNGNESKNMISLIFLVESNKSIDRIIDILEDKRVEASFFVDGNLVEEDKNILKTIISYKNVIGNIGYNYSYTKNSYSWLTNEIKKYQKNNYCYTESKNKEVLEICFKNGDYTIIPSIKIKKELDNNIKDSIKRGSIIAIEINETTTNELPILINYILSKGYLITNLDDHLEE